MSVLLRNNAPEIRSFHLKLSGDDLEFIPAEVDVAVGAPAGKIKSIVVDLAGKLPSGTRKLRLSQAFELYWDRVALFEKQGSFATRTIARNWTARRVPT